MVKALFDTNVLIDYLNGIPAAKKEIERFSDKAISVITWMEVMVGTTRQTKDGTEAFLRSFTSLPINDIVARKAVELRKQHKIKLPDAIVWATAHVADRLFVTRNTKDFAENEPGIRVPYKLHK